MPLGREGRGACQFAKGMRVVGGVVFLHVPACRSMALRKKLRIECRDAAAAAAGPLAASDVGLSA
jgi:hypothetical protein